MQKFLKSGLALSLFAIPLAMSASSHREAPLIAQDPLADNTDLYAFRSPDDPSTVTLIANFIPMQLPQGGPNYYHFSEDVAYEIHVDNDASSPGDEIIYRFTFDRVNEDPTTFFNIRLGKENLNTTYTLERSMDGGASFETILTDGYTPPYNIGPRSIESPAGIGSDYATLMDMANMNASTGERVFAGPVDDPFFVDFNVFDLGDSPRQNGDPRDGLACFNVHSLALQVPISTLKKAGSAAKPANILDGDFIIGVWASASRPATRTLSKDGDFASFDGDYVQVSRIGMPLTNEVVIPIGLKDYWNAITPYDELDDTSLDESFYNPELALYMDDDQFGGAVPAFAPLRVQTASLGAFDFTNGADGLFSLKGSDAVAGTALAEDAFGALLLPAAGKPRSVDLWPAFHTGVPNLPPYQLATGKAGNPLAAGKPFVNNFLPNGGDMLRLNMAVPVTPRDSEEFSSMGLLNAAVLGLTDPRFAGSADLQAIPNMDGFPNGRRLEDDVTRIELQAVSGVVLAAIGLWYDDYDPETSESPVTQDLLDVLTYTTEVEENDLPFTSSFPYLAAPRRGSGPCSGEIKDYESPFVDLELDIDLINRNFTKFSKVPYQITVRNTSAVAATGVKVSAPLPEGTVFSEATVSQGRYRLFSEEFLVGDLAPGASATLRLTVFTLTDDAPITQFVEVTEAMGPDFDSDPGNGMAMEDDDASITINPGRGGGGFGDGTADLSLTGSVPAGDYKIFERVPFTYTVRNDGPDAANNVVVRVGLPATTVFSDVSVSQGRYSLFFNEFQVGTLASGEEATITLTVFTLKDNREIGFDAEVFGVDEMDPDSKPANFSERQQEYRPREDDEVYVRTFVSGRDESLVEDDTKALLRKRYGDAELSVAPTLLATGDSPAFNLNVDAETVDVRLIAADGRVLTNQSFDVSGGSVAGNVDMTGASQGLYLVQFTVDGEPFNTTRIVVR